MAIKTIVFSVLFAVTITPASADECRDRFIKMVVGEGNKGPSKSYIEQWGGASLKSKNRFYYIETGHWMTEIIEPENMGWTLARNNVMYFSTDKGKTWKKVREMDSASNENNTLDLLAKSAKSTRKTKCGKEELDGVVHDVVEGEYTSELLKGEVSNKYWINPDTGWIAKTYTHSVSGSGESFNTQLMESVPDLTLPTPGE